MAPSCDGPAMVLLSAGTILLFSCYSPFNFLLSACYSTATLLAISCYFPGTLLPVSCYCPATVLRVSWYFPGTLLLPTCVQKFESLENSSPGPKQRGTEPRPPPLPTQNVMACRQTNLHKPSCCSCVFVILCKNHFHNGMQAS